MELLEGKVLFVSIVLCLQQEKQFLLAGFPETACEISVPFPTSLNGPSSPRYLLTTRRCSEQPTCYFDIWHFCLVWISEAELGSWRAFDETSSLWKEAGSRSPLLSASLSLPELCEGWERAWEGGSWGARAQMPYSAGSAVPPSPWREHPMGEGTTFLISEPDESFSGNTEKMSRGVWRGLAALPADIHPGPWGETGQRPPHCAGTPRHLCWKLTLPRIATQILLNYNGFSPAAKHLMGCFSSCFSFSALFPLCVLPTAVLCCPLQSRASFSFLSPSFTEFGNLIFAACLSPWRLLTVIDICIHIFLSCALSTVILWLYWIPSTSLRTFHGYPDRHTPSASGFCWLRDGWSSYLRLRTSVSTSRRCSHTLASNLTTSCCFNTTPAWVKRTWNPSVPNPLFPDWCGVYRLDHLYLHFVSKPDSTNLHLSVLQAVSDNVFRSPIALNWSEWVLKQSVLQG